MFDVTEGSEDHVGNFISNHPRLRELPITMLISTQDMKLVEELFPHTIVMDEGLIVKDGDTREILQDEKLFNEHGLEKP